MVLGQTDTTVNWGLKLFGSNNGCTVTAPPEVPVAAMNSTPVANRIGMTMPGSSTPTRAAIQAAQTYLTGLTDPNTKFILVATDGSPNCPANCTGGACMTTPNPTEEQAVVDAITAANTAGFKTFVVGIATASDADADMTLTNMANAGGVPRAGQTPPYYPIASQAELVTALGQIITVAGSCTFQVPNPPTNDGTTSRGDIAVKGDGTIIPQDANNGWTYSNANMTSVDLHGSACDAVKAGTVSMVSIVFHCHVP
jgi:hypothetical protein